jgi:putative addiction module component (TIGR02574 family)
MSELLEKAMQLPIPERIQLVEDIWNSIAAENPPIELTTEQVEELERRIEHHRLHPEDAIPWEEVRDRLLARQ